MLAVINVIINYNKTLSLFNKPQTNKHEQKSCISPGGSHLSMLIPPLRQKKVEVHIQILFFKTQGTSLQGR